jgi:hypothetical protein
MPTLIELRLKATWPVRPDTRQLHGLACALFEEPGREHGGQEKPFAVSPLQPAPGGSSGEWTWRAAWLPDSLPPAGALEADVIRVGHVSCVVAESTQRRVTHAALASGAAAGEVTVSFGSPVFFSQNGTDVLLPDPRLIAGSWRRRWNASLPEEDALVISDAAWMRPPAARPGRVQPPHVNAGLRARPGANRVHRDGNAQAGKERARGGTANPGDPGAVRRILRNRRPDDARLRRDRTEGPGMTAARETSIFRAGTEALVHSVFRLGRRGESGWSGACRNGGAPISAVSARFSGSFAQQAAKAQVRRPSGGHLLQSPARHRGHRNTVIAPQQVPLGVQRLAKPSPTPRA